ncbi:hypothetical protein N7499_009388 [Penicillium canescens]|nr:hypothetical protein N7499_009388 [Penicillium canescens]KAJ6170053.1 hypothetical protein N7485_007399 [Penicillium canescens]
MEHMAILKQTSGHKSNIITDTSIIYFPNCILTHPSQASKTDHSTTETAPPTNAARQCILACERIGDLGLAKEILDGIDDNDLFNECLEDFQRGIVTRSIFPAVAENALMFSVYAGDYEGGQRMADLILEISPKFFDELNENTLDGSFRLCHYSTIPMHNFHPERAFSRILQVRRAIELSRTQIADVDARIGSSWAGWTREVPINLAVICLRCRSAGVPVAVMALYNHGHPADISWEEHALLFREGSRAPAVLGSIAGTSKSGKAEGSSN